MPDTTERSATIPADPEAIFDAWIDPDRHTAMTGSPATGSSEVGGTFTAWNGFIEGEWLALERPGRIVMAWSTSAFPDGAPPSQVEVRLTPGDGGTLVHVSHTEIPVGQGAAYHHGWLEKYFEPMTAHFSD